MLIFFLLVQYRLPTTTQNASEREREREGEGEREVELVLHTRAKLDPTLRTTVFFFDGVHGNILFFFVYVPSTGIFQVTIEERGLFRS